MSRATGVLETLRQLDPYHVEQCVADIWQERQGWTTSVTDSSRDAGVDILGQPPDGGPLTAVQVKRYGPDNLVSSRSIQQYAALRQQIDRVQGVTVVTTSDFTQPARDRADSLDVKLVDGATLARIIDTYDAREIVEWYAAGKPEEW